MSVQETVQGEPPHNQYVDFWNKVLVPKFVRWRHILVGGLTLHSEEIFPSLDGADGRHGRRCRLRLWRYRHPACAPRRAVRVGAGEWTAATAFLSTAARTPRPLASATSPSWKRTCRPIRSSRSTISASRDSARSSSRTRSRAYAICARALGPAAS